MWRAAFAFDPRRKGILLVAGDKSGVSETKFYKRLIEKADKRYKEHLESLQTEERHGGGGAVDRPDADFAAGEAQGPAPFGNDNVSD